MARDDRPDPHATTTGLNREAADQVDIAFADSEAKA